MRCFHEATHVCVERNLAESRNVRSGVSLRFSKQKMASYPLAQGPESYSGHCCQEKGQKDNIRIVRPYSMT
jgi:hypothetical protein